MIDRPAVYAPLFGITANIRGSGKSKLAGIIAYGRAMARRTMPRTDEETGKVITAIAIEAKPAVLLDNGRLFGEF